MSNDSTTGGFLSPNASPVSPHEDDALDDDIQEIVVGITGLPGTLVRPRWQPSPPKEPAIGVDWCAIGVTDETADAMASVIHHGDGGGYDETQRHETIEVMASFFGPNSRANAKTLRDGLQIAQNRDEMRARGLALVDTGPARNVPDLLNQNWRKRVDMQITLRRQITRSYPVKNLASAQGSIVPENGDATSWNVEP